jgi:ribosomal protein L21E
LDEIFCFGNIGVLVAIQQEAVHVEVVDGHIQKESAT